MLNFTVGPVEMFERTKTIGSFPIPYFRTTEFSEVMLENECLILEFADAPRGSRAVFLTASATGAMEAAVVNTLTPADCAAVIDGGSFGHRFAEICQIHQIPTEIINLNPGESLTEQHLETLEDKGITALLVNLDETSTGVLYDLNLIAEFCRRNETLLIVDAVSAFLADSFSMTQSSIDVMITGSQKALALPPGISILALSPRALSRVEHAHPKCFYFDLMRALEDGERGQTPFTPAVGVLLQLNDRLRSIKDSGGAETEVARISSIASDFRQKIAEMPFQILPESPANGVTALRVNPGISAKGLFEVLKDEFDIWVCPNGGDLAETVFRVGHLGDLTPDDNDKLVSSLEEALMRLQRP